MLNFFLESSQLPVLEKEMATHSSILAWRIIWTEEPGGLLSMELHRVRHKWSDLAAAAVTSLEIESLVLNSVEGNVNNNMASKKTPQNKQI